MTSDSRPVTEVAVGIVFNESNQVLLACRPEGKPYAGWWEFPGGKIEGGETIHIALARELNEELGIQIGPSVPWLTREHSYEHARVRLHFRRVYSFDGEATGREGQSLGWCDPVDPGVQPLLPASVPLMRLLGLPDTYGISCAQLLGEQAFLQALARALNSGMRLVQLREPGMDQARFDPLFQSVLSACRDAGAYLMVNSCHDSHYWLDADGVHLRSADFDRLAVVDRSKLQWVSTSCHNADELIAAGIIEADFAVLGPVKPTQSHPGATPMGWEQFESMALATPIPVYALGGIAATDSPKAIACGAHGIAMMRAAFAA